MQNSKGS